MHQSTEVVQKKFGDLLALLDAATARTDRAALARGYTGVALTDETKLQIVTDFALVDDHLAQLNGAIEPLIVRALDLADAGGRDTKAAKARIEARLAEAAKEARLAQPESADAFATRR